MALTLVGIAGWVAIIGGTGKVIHGGITGAAAATSQSERTEDDRSAARGVKPGKAFRVGNQKTLTGWAVKRDTRLGDAQFSITGKVKNTGKVVSTVLIHFKLVDSHGKVLGIVQCNSADLKPGRTQALSCIPDGKYGKYEKVTAEARY